MTFNNLCSFCTNYGCEFQSGIVRTICAFYMPPHIESDNCGNYTVMQQIEAIQKDQYKARLKANMVAILEKIKAKIGQMNFDFGDYYDHTDEIIEMVCKVIDKYKSENEDK